MSHVKEPTPTEGALARLRVIDRSSAIAGPLAAMFLADFGADVVKIEPPGGDPSRAWPGSAVWNRGKRSGLLDPADAASTSAYGQLLETADVLVTNGPEETVARNPRLVQLVASPYLDGAPWPFTVESEGLLAATAGVSLRQASFAGGPVDAVFPILQALHGAWGAAAVVAALVERERSGLGQTVSIAGMHGVMVASSAALNFDPATPPPRRVGNAGGGVPFYRTYECGDGQWLFLAALTPRFTELAFKTLGISDLYDDPRLGGRGRAGMLHPDNVSWVTECIAGVFRTDSRDQWLDQLRAASCPAGPVLRREDWLDHAQIQAIGMRVEVDDPERGPVVMPGVPVTLHATPGCVRASAPPTPAGAPAMWSEPGWGSPAMAVDAGSGAGSGAGPLAGMTVIDLGAIIAGPFAASLLAELGASVVKAEPLTGDSFRGPGFAAYNKGQRGVAIDLRHPEGREALMALVRTADVVIDNYRPGVLGRLGLEWSDLRDVNPAVVSVSITGFGDGGPLGGEPGFDPVMQAMSGMMAAQGGDAEPVFFTVPVNDVMASAVTAFGALVALLHRVRTGHAQKVTASLAAMSALLQAGEIVRYPGRPAARLGSRDHRGASAFDRYYEASDGWIRVLAPDRADTPGAEEPLGRLGIDSGGGGLESWVAKRTRAEAVAQLLSVEVAAVVARPARELVDDEALLAHLVLRPDPRPDRQGSWTTGDYGHFSRTPPAATRPAPALGEHTVEVLTEAGLTPAEIEKLTGQGVVATGDRDRESRA